MCCKENSAVTVMQRFGPAAFASESLTPCIRCFPDYLNAGVLDLIAFSTSLDPRLHWTWSARAALVVE